MLFGRPCFGSFQCEGVDIPVIIGPEQLALQFLEVLIDERFTRDWITLALEGVEIIVVLQPFAYLVSEFVADLVFHFAFCDALLRAYSANTNRKFTS